MASIKDVAKEAGVAISTVSKVLNNYPNISIDTREKVERAVKKLKFVPNKMASALSSKYAGRIAIVIDQTAQETPIDEVDMRYLSGALAKAKELGLDVITIFYSMFKDWTHDDFCAYLRSESIGGLVMFGVSKDDNVLIKLAKNREYKCVLVDADIVNPSTSCVWIDQAQAQYDVISEVLKTDNVGSMLYISGKQNGFVTDYRTDAVKRLCEERGIALTVADGEFSEDRAREITLNEGRNYGMIACASDMMAIGTISALTQMDVFKPVCGFDGITLMKYVGNHVLTVKQDFYGISMAAVDELYALMHGSKGRDIKIPYEVVRL